MTPLRGLLLCRVLAIALLLPGTSIAGDEVDYSAPYITVENGELVTKYPAKEHVAATDTEAPMVKVPDESAAGGGARRVFWAGGLITILTALVLLIRRRFRA